MVATGWLGFSCWKMATIPVPEWHKALYNISTYCWGRQLGSLVAAAYPQCSWRLWNLL